MLPKLPCFSFLPQPENIVCVSKDSWDIKLIDFGLAQELVPGVRMTALKGTPEFMGKFSPPCPFTTHTSYRITPIKVIREQHLSFQSSSFLFLFSSLPAYVCILLKFLLVSVCFFNCFFIQCFSFFISP